MSAWNLPGGRFLNDGIGARGSASACTSWRSDKREPTPSSAGPGPWLPWPASWWQPSQPDCVNAPAPATNSLSSLPPARWTATGMGIVEPSLPSDPDTGVRWPTTNCRRRELGGQVPAPGGEAPCGAPLPFSSVTMMHAA